MMRAFAVLAALLFLPGCLGSGDPPASEAEKGRDPLAAGPAALNATSVTPVPAWTPGTRWTWDTASAGGAGPTFDSIVVGSGGSYRLATTDAAMAKDDAAFDHPLLGDVAAADLGLTGWGGAWDLLDFPLTDGATWQGAMPNIAFDAIDGDVVVLDLNATFDPAIAYAGTTAAGYRIAGVASGLLVLEADFVPEAGWLTRIVVHDIDATEDPDQDPLEVAWIMTAMETGWSGTYQAPTAELLLEHMDRLGFTDDPSQGGAPVAEPAPYKSFNVAAGVTDLYGFAGSFVAFGAHEMALVPPEGEPRRLENAQPGGFSEMRMTIDEPAIPGAWHLVSGGGGGHAGGFAIVFGITAATGTLAPAEPDAAPAAAV